MIAQRCPKCGSRRVRRGYRNTPIILRLIGVYALLCDNCNLLFTGFAVPGTVPEHGTHRKNQRDSKNRSDDAPPR